MKIPKKNRDYSKLMIIFDYYQCYNLQEIYLIIFCDYDAELYYADKIAHPY